jgi:hypothetical protein
VRWVIGCTALLLLAAGCGGTLDAGDGTTTPVQLTDPPPITSVDRPADEYAFWWRDDPSSTTLEFWHCAVAAQAAPSASARDCQPTDEQKAQLRADMQRQRDAVQPATGASPRMIAELTLADGGRAELAAWSNTKGELCLGAAQLDAQGTGVDVGPFGPCLPDGRCDGDFCFQELRIDRPRDSVLVAVVPARADLITVTLRDRRERAYPLAGPLVTGFPSERVFMADLGQGYRRLDVSESGSILAHTEKPPQQLAMEGCAGDYGSPTGPEGLKAAQDAFEACVHGATRTAAPAGG